MVMRRVWGVGGSVQIVGVSWLSSVIGSYVAAATDVTTHRYGCAESVVAVL